MKRPKPTSILVALALILGTWCTTKKTDATEKLTIGSKAPPLAITHWLSNGNGQFNETKNFKMGQVYVLEFWATWCGPCVASMPEISKLQNEYASQGVQIISVSDEELNTVKTFLTNKVDGKSMTYGQLTSNYCLTTDPDGSVHKSYMEASKQAGIPTAFIIGKDGCIEWIGHPIEMKEPLKAVLNDQWNRQDFSETFKTKQEIKDGMQRTMTLFRQGKFEDGLTVLEQLIKKAPVGSDIANQMKMIRFSILISTNDPRSTQVLQQMTAENNSDPGLLNQLAWGIVEMSLSGQQVEKPLTEAARHAVDIAARLAPHDAAILDTQAHLAMIQGNLEQAIKIQTKAVESANEEIKADLERFLKQLNSLKKEKDEHKASRK